MMGDEEEEKRKKQRTMKSWRREAAMVNELGEIQGIAGAGASRHLTSWIWMASGDRECNSALHEGRFLIFS